MADQYDSYDVDLKEIACAKVTAQFQSGKSVFIPTLFTFVDQLQDIADNNLDILKARSIDLAMMKMLDNIGDLLGLPRGIDDTILLKWWTVDNTELTVDTTDVGAWITGASLYKTATIDDETYRQRLRGQAFKNHTIDGIGDFYAWCKISYGINITLIRDMQNFRDFILGYVIDEVTEEEIKEITTLKNTDAVKNQYFSPIPPGFRFTYSTPLFIKTFAFDVRNDLMDGWDVGRATIFQPLNLT